MWWALSYYSHITDDYYNNNDNKFFIFITNDFFKSKLNGAMVRVFPLSMINLWFDPESVQIKDYEIGIWCFPT
jgi:hypothetical protein